jgi:outer membrane protein
MYFRVSALSLSALAAASAACMGAAHAQQAPKDGGRVGLVALGGYEYQGSDETRTLVLPTLDYTWANGWFAGASGVGHTWSTANGLQYGVKLTYDPGREESRSSALKGLGNLDAGAELGGFAHYALGSGLVAKTSLRVGSGVDNKGALWDVGLEYGKPLAADWHLGAGVAATYANGDYLQSYFGVTTQQSIASGYREYRPSAGLRDVAVRVSLTYMLSPTVALTGAVANTSLMGDAKDGPMVRKTNATSGLLALSYSF